MRTRDSSSSASSSSSSPSASRGTDDETTSADDNYDDDVDLFYDATLDAKDEKRVRGKKKNNNDATEAETDAILSCPKCLSTVCTQCQRHEKFDLQFRAVESFGTTTVDEDIFTDDNGSFRGRKVRCEACEETVGLLDEEDVYHFFNVVPSN
jgi:hypothetical protein